MSKKLSEIGLRVYRAGEQNGTLNLRVAEEWTNEWRGTHRLLTEDELKQFAEAAVRHWLDARAFAVVYGSDMERWIEELDL